MRDRIRSRVEQARRQRFERIVIRALDGLSPEVVSMLDNVEIIVEDEPTVEQLALGQGYPEPREGARDVDEEPLFGLYEGVPLTHRVSDYHLVPPDLFLFNDSALAGIYTLSLHDAVPTPARRRCPGA